MENTEKKNVFGQNPTCDNTNLKVFFGVFFLSSSQVFLKKTSIKINSLLYGSSSLVVD